MGKLRRICEVGCWEGRWGRGETSQSCDMIKPCEKSVSGVLARVLGPSGTRGTHCGEDYTVEA